MGVKNITTEEEEEEERKEGVSPISTLISLVILYYIIEYLYGNRIVLIVLPCVILLIIIEKYFVLIKNEREKVIMNKFQTLESYLISKKEIVLKEGSFIVESSYIESIDQNRLLEFIVSLESKSRLTLNFNKNEQQYELINLNVNDTCIQI